MTAHRAVTRRARRTMTSRRGRAATAVHGDGTPPVERVDEEAHIDQRTGGASRRTGGDDTRSRPR